jgi:type IV secretion system protein VirB10
VAQTPTTITLREGTRVLLMLKSPLHTTSAADGAGIFAEVISPVIGEGRVLIPLRSQVQGVIEAGRRPGRVKGKAQLLLHFNTLILPNNYVSQIDGALQGVPGSRQLRSRTTRGTIEPVDQIDKDGMKILAPLLAGAAIGSLRSLGIGTLTGGASGAAFGILHVLVTRGDEIQLPAGTTLEMVLQSPLTLEVGRLP